MLRQSLYLVPCLTRAISSLDMSSYTWDFSFHFVEILPPALEDGFGKIKEEIGISTVFIHMCNHIWDGALIPPCQRTEERITIPDLFSENEKNPLRSGNSSREQNSNVSYYPSATVSGLWYLPNSRNFQKSPCPKVKSSRIKARIVHMLIGPCEPSSVKFEPLKASTKPAGRSSNLSQTINNVS